MGKYKYYYFFICALFILACTGNVNKKVSTNADKFEKASNPKSIIDSLTSLSRKELDIENISIDGDTLKFVTSARELYYPLGKFRKIDEVIGTYPMFKLNVGENTDSEDISKVVFGHSYFKFYKDEETGYLEIVYAVMIDPNIKFTNNIEIGMSSNQFYQTFFKQPLKLNSIRIVKAESLVTGVIHYYYVKDGKLMQVEIDSDYQIDKS